MNKKNTALTEAPQSVQLAVDLIELLEDNHIETAIAIDALKIVLNDFENKQATSNG